MARSNNFLLGRGEQLSRIVDVPSGGAAKQPPYDFGTARHRVAERVERTVTEFARLPDEACPHGEVVAVMTMHPRYISKTDRADDLLEAVGLRAVGSRSRLIAPEAWGIKKPPEKALTEDLFVAGTRKAFARWADAAETWSPRAKGADTLATIEDLTPFRAKEKLRNIPRTRERPLLEVVLHNAKRSFVVPAFDKYVRSIGGEPFVARQRDVGGLSFIPVRISPDRAADLARFAFVRVARGMPTLRPFKPGILRGTSGFAVTLPDAGPLQKFRAVVFDGGLPAGHPLGRWVTLFEPEGIGRPVRAYQQHGLAVTGALLFGPLEQGREVPPPLCQVDHVRVLDERTGVDDEEELYLDVLDRITGVLDADPKKYVFVNISLGPALPIEDDEVTAWTALLDERFTRGRLVATVAVGNDGERDSASGMNRVQPPADAVNALAVGACDSLSETWERAAYSCVGPGRSPGLVKPDGVVFGGSTAEPMMVLGVGSSPHAQGEAGTSFAAPLALRSAVAVRCQLGDVLQPLAIRGLMIHRADAGAHPREEVGWGRFETDPEALITCEDDEALVVFQGDLPAKRHLRTPVPMPKEPLVGTVNVTATLVIGPETDPEHPSAYTRSGLEVSFRPHAEKHSKREDGGESKHPKTISFFSQSNMYSAAEYELRDDGHKWEPCLRASRNFRAGSLRNPCFDIYYHHREAGAAGKDHHPIPYALIVSVRAARVPDLYNRVVRAYAHVLVQLKPRLRIGVRTQ